MRNRSNNNKYHLYNSLYLNYICFEVISDPLHCNLSLKQNNNKIKDNLLQRHKSNEYRTCSTFKTKIMGDEFEFTHHIPALDDVSEQNVIGWTTAMINLSNKCNWTPERLLNAAKQAVNTKYWNSLQNITDFNQLFSILLSTAYTPQDQSELRNKIANTFQQDYEYIEDYRSDLDDLITVLGIINGKTQNEIKNTICESFFNNLHPKTKYEMSRLGIHDYDLMYERIKGTEQTIKNIHANENKMRTSKSKWCDHHRTDTHGNNECFSRRKQNKERNHKANNRKGLRMYL